mmetsp:Transcript_10242/g.22201  ORF Transcript_10242/g.22201 Transcript_10242/m.22201 type:complete len:206 (-) Transcript_10242:162-779(-)
MRLRMKSDRPSPPPPPPAGLRGSSRCCTSVVRRDTCAATLLGPADDPSRQSRRSPSMTGVASRLTTAGSSAARPETALQTPSRTSSSDLTPRTNSPPPPPPAPSWCRSLAAVIPSYSSRTESPSAWHRSHTSRIAVAAWDADPGTPSDDARYGRTGPRLSGCIPSQDAYRPATRHAVARRRTGPGGSWGIRPATKGTVDSSSGGT